MSKEEVYKDLQSLLDEVDGLALEDTERYRLHRLISDIESHLETPAPESSSEMENTLDELVTRLEADHPAFTGILRRVMHTLASMGV